MSPDQIPPDDYMGSIFEAGYERQAKRLAAELEDDAAVDAWLGGGRSW